jgi:hypothetical protein
METPRPHANCYWVKPDQLLAGEYPGNPDPLEARRRLERYLDAGITFFVDLTEPHELDWYDEILGQAAAARGLEVEYRRLSIRDVDIPRSRAEMVHILDTIDRALASGNRVYVHCWGGVGRTGTTVGCWLVRHGQSGEEALQTIARHWQTVAKRNRHRYSPETFAQKQYVRTWPE